MMSLLTIAALEKRRSTVLQHGAGKCAWSAEADYEYWSSSCGLLWTLIDGSPAENGMTFCPRCGRRITVALV